MERQHLAAAILNSLPEAVIGLAPDGSIETWNPAAAALFGYAADEAAGQDIATLVAADEAEALAEAYRRLRGGEDSPPLGLQCLTKDRQPLRVTLFLTRVEDGRGEMLGICAMARRAGSDVASDGAPQQALAEKEVLIREVHHRVKNNLQTIVSLLNLQMRGTGSAQLREQFQDAQARIKALSTVHDLVYRSEDLAHIELRHLFESICAQLFQTYGGDQRVRCVIDIPPIHTNVDNAIALALLATEAVTNSLKHGFPNGRSGSVRIGLEARGEKVILSMSDNGVGFRRGRTEANRRHSLGLTLIRSLASQLGAEARIDGSDGVAIQLTLLRACL